MTQRAVPPQEINAWEQNEEGGVFKAKVYDDGSGNPTQGFGHTGPEVVFGGPDIDLAQANAWVAQDLRAAQDAVDHLVVVPLDDNQDSALVDFAGNAGGSALASSTLLRKLNAGDYAGAADEFLRWTYAKDLRTGKLVYSAGLANRRAKERSMFLMPGGPALAAAMAPKPAWLQAHPEIDAGPDTGTAPPPLSQSTTIFSAIGGALAGPAGMLLAYIQSPYALIALGMLLVFAFVIYKERQNHRTISGV